MELTPEVCWHIYLVLVLHILQLWLPCGLREAVHSCQDTLCTSHAPITWLSTDSDKLQKREVVSWDWSSSSQTIPWLCPSSAFCSLRKVASTIAPGPLSPWWSLCVLKPSPQGPLAIKSLMEGLLKGTASYACPQINPTCSGLRLHMLDWAWFKSSETCLWSLARERIWELSAFSCQQREIGQDYTKADVFSHVLAYTWGKLLLCSLTAGT